MRSFIGIPLNDIARDEIFKLYPDIKDLRFIRKENLHITVKFLGEIQEKRIEKIKDIIEESCSDISKFKISCKRLSAFPSLTSARIIWVNVMDGADTIEKIYKKLENKLANIGFEKEKRKYIPHITIARAKSSIDITEYLHNFEINSMASEIVLYKSDLKPNGPIYTEIFKYNFKD
ncbi:MAG: RNA 2',3'-cyclic phosphodiesterase [Candidatus Goldbacteria bacterium]|nr:RNA 2',3'-cyclic phosphodiesterase [Candidatus Goldiibacteriota bacterium]